MILGADISTLEETEHLGGRFFDTDGREDALLPILKKYGFSAVRLRLWNDPYAEDGAPYKDYDDWLALRIQMPLNEVFHHSPLAAL